jgi:hypothetical protein
MKRRHRASPLVRRPVPASPSRRAKYKTLKVFTSEDGGVEHCQVDNRQVGTDYICDWLSARLL